MRNATLYKKIEMRNASKMIVTVSGMPSFYGVLPSVFALGSIQQFM